MIAITFALPAESSGLVKLIRDKTRADHNGVVTIRGKIANHSVEIFHTGVGEKRCRERMANFLQDRQFDCLISAGFAGALTNELKAGDVLLARNFSTLRLRDTPDRRVHVADLYTAATMIDSREERETLAQNTGAVAVDMETKFIARACAEHALPMLSLRVISDTPREPLPAPPTILFDIVRQRTNSARLAAFFLIHPARVPRLLQFAHKIARARKILADTIVTAIGCIA